MALGETGAAAYIAELSMYLIVGINKVNKNEKLWCVMYNVYLCSLQQMLNDFVLYYELNFIHWQISGDYKWWYYVNYYTMCIVKDLTKI